MLITAPKKGLFFKRTLFYLGVPIGLTKTVMFKPQILTRLICSCGRWLKVFRNKMLHTYLCWLPCTCNKIYNISVHVGHAYAQLHIQTRFMYLFSMISGG